MVAFSICSGSKQTSTYTCPISLFHRTYLAGQTCRQLPPCKTTENKSRATSHTFPLAMLCASGRAWQAPGERAVDQFLMAILGGCRAAGPGAGWSASTSAGLHRGPDAVTHPRVGRGDRHASPLPSRPSLTWGRRGGSS